MWLNAQETVNRGLHFLWGSGAFLGFEQTKISLIVSLVVFGNLSSTSLLEMSSLILEVLGHW